MSRRALVVGLILTSCAEVPSSVCFSDEPCADGGAPRGGGGGGAQSGGGGGGGGAFGGGQGGGATGGGAQGGGATGGGATGGGVPGGGGGFTRMEITDSLSGLGVPVDWSEVELGLPVMTAPSFLVEAPVSMPALTLRNNCTEAYRGAVLLPDDRVLAIPFCASRFLLIDVVGRTVSAVGPPVIGIAPLAPNRGWYAGGVLGCDARAYLFPFEKRSVMRVTPLDDGGLLFDDIPLVGAPTPPEFIGGVVGRPCERGFRVFAGGLNGINALDVYEDVIDVTPVGAPGTFYGLALVGDGVVMGVAQEVANMQRFTRVNPDTLQVSTSSLPSTLAHFGVASTTTQRGLVADANGRGQFLLRDGGLGPLVSQTVPSALRWPTNTITGWTVAVSSAQLVGWSDDALSGAFLVSPPTGYVSGGLTMTGAGALVSVPGGDGGTVLFFTDPNLNVGTDSLALSFWFNKL